jgi:hypothetical protein
MFEPEDDPEPNESINSGPRLAGRGHLNVAKHPQR